MPQDRSPAVATSMQQVAAANHPLRRRLLEILGVEGPATASRLSAETGQLVGNVSHHLKVLASAGLIEEAPELAKDRRERWWRSRRVSVSWSLADAAGDPAAEAVATAAESYNLAHHLEKVQQWFEARHDYDEAWTRAAFATDTWLHLTPEELSELGDRIAGVVAEFKAAHPGAGQPEDEQERERKPVYVFAHGVPGRP